MEHIQLFAQPDLDRYLDLGITGSVQPVFVPSDWQLAQRRWGQERCTRAYAWQTLLNKGIPLQFGTDAPLNPSIRFWASRQRHCARPRRTAQGGWTPGQCLTLEQCLTGYTRQAAWTAGKEDQLGMLKPGFLADITVFEKDLTAVPPKNGIGSALK